MGWAVAKHPTSQFIRLRNPCRYPARYLVDCLGGGLQRCAILWLMNASFLVDSVGRPTSLPPRFSSIPLPFPFFLPILSFPLVIALPSLPHPSFSRMALARSHGQAQMPPEGRGGGHQARDRPGSQRLRLPPQRPARALPRPGPHAPISEEPLGGVGERSAK